MVKYDSGMPACCWLDKSINGDDLANVSDIGSVM